jgi:hypothetical protein
MKCVTCGVNLNSKWKELVKDVNHPQCGFCDGTVFTLFNKPYGDLTYDLKQQEE